VAVVVGGVGVSCDMCIIYFLNNHMIVHPVSSAGKHVAI
jgi:hypothetical protein